MTVAVTRVVPIVGESREARQAVVLGVRMYAAPPNSSPPPRKSDVFRVDPEVRQLRERLAERIANAKTILRGKGAE